jgi:hypothetical protein
MASCGEAAVDGDGGAGEVVAAVAGQVGDQGGDVFGAAVVAEGGDAAEEVAGWAVLGGSCRCRSARPAGPGQRPMVAPPLRPAPGQPMKFAADPVWVVLAP